MHKYAYPAVFTEEDNGMYSVEFPDVEGCVTCGDDLNDAMENARDALSLMLCEIEDSDEALPKASKLSDIESGENGFVTLIDCDTLQYRKLLDNSDVTMTVTIPGWLSSLAKKADINCSDILKRGLLNELGI